MMSRQPIVALVGRPNVGKSTLFNRLVGQRLAVVHESPGTTRDRLQATCEWLGEEFTVVDTGGIEVLPEKVTSGRRPEPDRVLAQDSAPFLDKMRAQAELAIGEADAIILLTDAVTGLNVADEEVADILRRSEKPIFVAANKAESETARAAAVDFYALGLGEVFPISALHGIGVADLLDAVVEALPEFETAGDEAAISLAIVGRPNVGKSSLLNKLLGQERTIVHPGPGTTRDAIDTSKAWE